MNARISKGTAIVTGASAGLGRIYADRLAGRGYDLLLVARRADKLDGVAKHLAAAHGIKVSTLVADLGAEADLAKVEAVLATDPGITLLVNNAGTSTLAEVGATSLAQLDSMTGVNVTALARLSHAALAAFKGRDHGTLINIGSVLAFTRCRSAASTAAPRAMC